MNGLCERDPMQKDLAKNKLGGYKPKSKRCKVKFMQVKWLYVQIIKIKKKSVSAQKRTWNGRKVRKESSEEEEEKRSHG